MSVENTTTEVTSTEFRAHSGQYIEESAKRPVYITKHGRTMRVLIDIEEYERLKAIDAPRVVHPSELDDELKAELEKGYQGSDTPELNHLMD